MAYPTRPGRRFPPGAVPDSGGVNFSVFSRHASRVELLLYESAETLEPSQVIELDPQINRTFFFWHVYVEGVRAGTCYNWRVDGPADTRGSGHRFDGHKCLLDPWARTVAHTRWDRGRACRPGDNGAHAMRSVVVIDDYDWEGDRPLQRPLEDSIIYELHVRGFTRHPSSGVAQPGTFAGLIEKIPYLQRLGVTDVELLPVMAFDEQDLPLASAALGLRNYWGYSPHSFYSPHPGYCSTSERGRPAREFRDMVKAVHRAGIGVILDVVFNHTAEGGEDGPIISFKGLFNEMFYHLDPEDRRLYRDYTACGNSINCNHPLVTRFLVECLEYWVREMHVDGFRFDLASVLVRGIDGQPLYYAPAPWSIEFSDELVHTKLIAEAWDAGGLYQVGGFPGYRWAEWNGRYRDVIRRFVRGDKGFVGEVASRITGSSDLYGASGRLPGNSINLITCHDGFTLNDLVSYERKHNEPNGEENRDGSDMNLSWNCGWEGETEDPVVLLRRRRQVRNFLAILLISQGVPMLLFGDEVLRSQQGDNNAYCQDNDLSWLDWGLMDRNADMLRFVREMIALRRRHPSLRRRRFLTGQRCGPAGLPDVTWHGERLAEPPWLDPQARLLAFTLAGTAPDEEHLHVILNMSESAPDVPLPDLPPRSWFRAVDTALSSPEDILPPAEQPRVPELSYRLGPRSVVVLEAR